MVYRQRTHPRVIVWPDGTAASKLDLSAIVVSFNTSKSLAGPTGRWSVTLAPSLVRGARALGAHSDLAQLLGRPNAVISIGWDRPGGIMAGLVDSVQRSRSFSGGRVNDTITLTGSDFGKVLANDHIVRAALTVPDAPDFITAVEAVAPGNTLTTMLPGLWGPNREDGSNTFAQATVREVAEWVVSRVPALRIPLLAGSGGSGLLGDFISVVVPDTWNDGRIQNENLWTFEGSIWSFLQGIIDADFYEVFVDTYASLRKTSQTVWVGTNDDPDAPIEDAIYTTTTTGTVWYGGLQVPTKVAGLQVTKDGPQVSGFPEVALVIRPKPFDEPGLQFLETSTSPQLTWGALRTVLGSEHHVIELSAVLSEQMGISDADVFNYYLVQSQFDVMGNPNSATLGMFFPALDLYGLQRHGLRTFDARLSLLGSYAKDKEADGDTFTSLMGREVFDFRNRLFNWYRLNEFFESGSITVVGADHYRIGEPVFLPWRRPFRGGTAEQGASLYGMRYYCVSTSHQWSFGGIYTTTLSLTRGHNQALIDQASFEIGQVGTAYGLPGMKIAVGSG